MAPLASRLRERPFVIIGGGGHGLVVWSLLRALDCEIRGFVDSKSGAALDKAGLCYLGGDQHLDLDPNSIWLANGIGSVTSLQARTSLFERYVSLGYEFPALIHPFTFVAEGTQIDDGAQVMAGAVVQPGCMIGSNTIVNTAASIDHDCRIGAHCHVAPGSTLSGGVVVEAGVHIGTGAVIIQGVHIGTRSVVAAGSVVVKAVKAGTMVIGHPAKPAMKEGI